MSFNGTIVRLRFILTPSAAVLAQSGVVNDDSLRRQKFAAQCVGGISNSLGDGFWRNQPQLESICRHFPKEVFYEECEEWLRFHSAGGDRRNPDAARLWACSGLHSERDRNGSKRRCHTGRDSDGLAYGIRQQI